jgi:hypothetical protein
VYKLPGTEKRGSCRMSFARTDARLIQVFDDGVPGLSCCRLRWSRAIPRSAQAAMEVGSGDGTCAESGG